ncbi:PREDICTED: serine protease inhibitor 2.1-like [Papilio xuthus]|uniref:Serine protease inhibitor 2.1-like n=1 Tax=Papilio xuthus TaxID=66420 RepID=A0AAJ6ZAY6_PAPXU|nr:PREDICTED: serine protease inhibitor 2.1-like [Papilio xuthus]
MYRFVTFLFFASTCYCKTEFSGRARNFSIELLHYTAQETGGHVVISPFGVWTLMTGVALGATGQSYEQLTNAFVLPKNPLTLITGFKKLSNTVLNPTTPAVSLTSKNFVFLDHGFMIYDDFKKTLLNDFGATIQTLNFKDSNKAAEAANSIIQKSGATVSNVLRSDDFMDSRMILTNAISFKGLWALPFNKSETTEEPFFDENNKQIGKVNMMYQKAPVAFSNIRAMNALALDMPYGNDGKYSMLLILPYPKVKVTDVYKKFESVSITDIYKQLQTDVDEFGLEEIDVRIPRFRISTNVVLNKPLGYMGVKDIFQPHLATFGRVTKEEIFVSAIVHKADIEVTESGTVASAATSAYIADRIATPNFQANRPFIYFVMEKSTATVIFGGIYSKPTIF